VIKDFDIERLFWIILGRKCNHKDPYKEKREVRSKEEVVDVIPEARGWNDAEKGS